MVLSGSRYRGPPRGAIRNDAAVRLHRVDEKPVSLDHQASTLVDPLMREAAMRMMPFLAGPLGNPHSAASPMRRTATAP